jgi:predicted DNA-binding transcriptional regulator
MLKNGINVFFATLKYVYKAIEEKIETPLISINKNEILIYRLIIFDQNLLNIAQIFQIVFFCSVQVKF